MKKSFIAILIIFLFCAFISPTFAAMHRWVDEKGKVWITDYPKPKSGKPQKQDAGTQEQAQPSEQQPVLNPAPGQEAQKKDVPGIAGLPEDVRKQLTGIIPGEGSSLLSSSMLAMISGFMIIFAIAFYIYISLCLFLIAKKLGLNDAWTAWIPIVNLWTLVEAAGRPWWWTAIVVGLSLLSAIPVVGMLLALISVGIVIYLWMCISENMGKNKWLGLLMLVPIVNLFYPAVLAFSKIEPISDIDSPTGQSTSVSS